MLKILRKCVKMWSRLSKSKSSSLGFNRCFKANWSYKQKLTDSVIKSMDYKTSKQKTWT